jgi:hypothetical protein
MPLTTGWPALARWALGGLAVVVVAVGLAALAYQRQPTLDLAIGDETSDKGVVRNFYADERREDGYRYRWTRGTSWLALPAWGPGPYRLTIEMGAPLNPRPSVTLLLNEVVLAEQALTGDFRPYTYEVPAALVASGDLTLTFRAATFSPPNDRRTLGVVVHRVTLEPTTTRPYRPPTGGLAAVAGLALLAYATLAAAGWAWRVSLAGAVGLAAAMAGLLVWARPLLVPVLGELGWIGGLALGLTLLGRLGLAGLARWPRLRLPAGERAWLLTIVAAALLPRLAATFHPQMDIIDLGFHVNRYTDVVERGMIFLKIRSAEWGGRETTYSPTAYLAMAPLGWLIDDKHRMMRIFTVLLETSRALLVFALARWVAGGGRAALLATTLFVSLPLAAIVFSWGITSNLFGEWWATALLLTLTVGWRRLTRPAVAALAVVVATLALLSHPGVLLLTAAWLGLLSGGAIAGWLWRRWRGRAAPGDGRTVAAVALVTVLAGVLAVALFYRVDAAMMLEQGSATIGQRLSGAPAAATGQPRRWRVSGSVDDRSLGMAARYVTDWRQVPLEGARGYLQEAWAYYWFWPLPAAVVGWLLLGGTGRGRRFRWLTLAWAAAAALFALVGLTINLYVRYMLFLLPVVCVLAGVALDRLAGRGRAGLALTALLIAGALAGGLWFWHQRVVYFFH